MITRTRVIAAAMAIATALAAGAVLAQSPSDFDGVVDVTIRNNSTTTAIHGPVAVEVRAQNMVDGGYIEDDGSDILFTDDANLPAGGVAPVLDSNEATWWWYVDAEPESSTDVRLFAGGPAIEPLFPFDENASVTIDDNADLDQTATLDLVVEFVAEELPDGTAQIVTKSGAYELGIRDDGELYATLTLENLTDILRPDGAGAETSYANLRGDCTYAWQCIDEVTADDSASYIYQGNTTGTMAYRSYTLTNHSIPTGATLQEARVVHRASLYPNSQFVQPGLRRYSYRKLGAEYTSEASGYATAVSESIDRPVCCGHTWPDMPTSHLNDMEVVIGVKQTNTFVPPLTQVYVEVDYRASTDVDPVLTHQGIGPGRRYLVRLALDGSTATLDVDGVEVDTATMPRAIRDSDSDLIIGGDDDGDGVAFHGGIGGLVIGPSAATSTLSMSFGSDAITPGTTARQPTPGSGPARSRRTQTQGPTPHTRSPTTPQTSTSSSVR